MKKGAGFSAARMSRGHFFLCVSSINLLKNSETKKRIFFENFGKFVTWLRDVGEIHGLQNERERSLQ